MKLRHVELSLGNGNNSPMLYVWAEIDGKCRLFTTYVAALEDLPDAASRAVTAFKRQRETQGG